MEMLFQPYCFFSMLYFGILVGLLYESVYLITHSFKKLKILKFILDFVWAICVGVIFFVALNFVNFGQFRLYLTLSFILGVFLERKLLGFYVDKAFVFIYNVCVKVFNKIKKIKWFKKEKNDTTKT